MDGQLPAWSGFPALSRRQLLERLALLAAAAALPSPLGACTSTAQHGAHLHGIAPAASPMLPPPRRVFDSREWAVIEAACDRLIPADDLPGATEAGVVAFIDGQLALPHFAIFRREFEAGVSALELLAAARTGGRFLEAAPPQQDEVLSALESGEGSCAGFSASHFFLLLLTLTLEGFLSDPSHGGNRNGAGWQVLSPPGAPHPGGSHG